MPDAYMIETDTAVAGVLVRDEDRYRLFASGSPFLALDGQLFLSPAAAEQAARRCETDDLQARRRPAV